MFRGSFFLSFFSVDSVDWATTANVSCSFLSLFFFLYFLFVLLLLVCDGYVRVLAMVVVVNDGGDDYSDD
ncbi:hypothetical protein L195_g026671 [Trifolium pratense]|uniref:Uncharacterized protein n=1 Tax=Trifolium pratense TaxID=57577 RepID=A0A2K3NJY3_TRIPR|nr:hypothetical protein L195_g026671 [Trifolium pratense]